MREITQLFYSCLQPVYEIWTKHWNSFEKLHPLRQILFTKFHLMNETLLDNGKRLVRIVTHFIDN